VQMGMSAVVGMQTAEVKLVVDNIVHNKRVSDDLGSIPASGIVGALGGALPGGPGKTGFRTMTISGALAIFEGISEEAATNFLTTQIDTFLPRLRGRQ
jgi:hypothetical protein